MKSARSKRAVSKIVLFALSCMGACSYDFDQFVDSSGGASSTGGASVVTSGSASSAGTGGRASTGGASSGGTSGSSATSCMGVSYQSVCWYLGSTGASCQAICSTHGQVAANIASFVGTAAQGGSLTECAAVLSRLGISQAPNSGTRSDGNGLGCHLFGGVPWWLSSPAFSASASDPSTRIACGCTR